MYWLNKIVWFLLNPMTLTILGAAVGMSLFACRGRRARLLGGILAAVSLAALWFISSRGGVLLLGLPLERPYLASQDVASLPAADAIVVLGGGICKTERMTYPDMFEGADRVWHAARAWKAGKAPVVVVSGANDLVATVPLLLDLGVPREAIVVDNESRNTYENSRFTERLLLSRAKNAEGRGAPPSVLLVTSAWHMTRALGNFSRTSLTVVPAPCDFSVCNVWLGGSRWWDWVVPSADATARPSYLFREWLGRLARR